MPYKNLRGNYFKEDSLFGTIGFYLSCIFFLLPVIGLYSVIGEWAWLAGLGCWIIVFAVFTALARLTRRNK